MARFDPFLERWRTPPVLRLLTPGIPFHGRHTNKVWRGLVHDEGGVGNGVEAIVKWMPKQESIATELACALAAQALYLRVPPGVIVLAEADQLPGLPAYAVPESGAAVVCFGSELRWSDGLFVRPTPNNPEAEETVWNGLCHSKEGVPGAAWDELVANSDRHYENTLFDGRTWWLFDHERALPPLATAMRRIADAAVRQKVIDYAAKQNELAAQIVRRRPNDHRLADLPAEFAAHKTRLSWVVEQVKRWSTGDSMVDGIFRMTEVILSSVQIRLPALALHIGKRLQKPEGDSLWKPSSKSGSRARRSGQ
ncbi:MAG TPA: hypothetical protein VGN52_11445 [Burkholderiales bacterium]|jgi:hypothetical protein